MCGNKQTPHTTTLDYLNIVGCAAYRERDTYHFPTDAQHNAMTAKCTRLSCLQRTHRKCRLFCDVIYRETKCIHNNAEGVLRTSLQCADEFGGSHRGCATLCCMIVVVGCIALITLHKGNKQQTSDDGHLNSTFTSHYSCPGDADQHRNQIAALPSQKQMCQHTKCVHR